jgi:protein-tyrosine phosphatase
VSIEFDRVLPPQVFVGTYPENPEDIDELGRELQVTAVLNLQTEEDFGRLGCDWASLAEAYRRAGIEVCRVPIRDFDTADLTLHLTEGVQALKDLLERGHTVYVHCSAGLGRSPSVVIAYLHWVEGVDLAEAIDQVNQRHPCVPNEEAIRKAIPTRRR